MSSFEAPATTLAADARPARGPGRPVGADGDRTRRLVLERALTAFAERGYDGVSVRRLARELRVSHNLIHHYYGSKRGLWEAAVELAFDAAGRDLFAWIERNSRRPDWEDAARESIREAVLWLARHPAAAAILADEAARGGARLDFLFERYVRPFAALLTALLAERRPGRDVDPGAALLFLFSGATALFTLRGLAARLRGPASDSEQEVKRYADTLAELSLHGLARPGRKAGRRARATPRRAKRRKHGAQEGKTP